MKKQGIPDVLAAAKLVINFWNDGKIKWVVKPPQVSSKMDMDE